MASLTLLAAVPRAVFPPEVAIHVVRLACERPDRLGRILSQWDCAELARQLERQQECIAFLEHVDQEIAKHIWTIHLVCDNVSTHHGQEVTRWFAKHPRFVVHFTPVHCSWINQVEQ